MFRDYTAVRYENGKMIADISAVPKTTGRADTFYISAKHEITSYSGCTLAVHERKNGFINYAVTPTADLLTFA